MLCTDFFLKMAWTHSKILNSVTFKLIENTIFHIKSCLVQDEDLGRYYFSYWCTWGE